MRKGLRLLQILGITLILLSLGLLAGVRLLEGRAHERSAVAGVQLEELLRVRTPGIQMNSSDTAMPALELDGIDYACLLEVPRMSVRLPVCDRWEDRYFAGNPCRYWGSCLDGSLILGGNRLSQLDFCSQLELGDTVLVTDLRGREFSYRVSSIQRSDSVTFQQLTAGESPLTIFTRDGLSSRSIIVRCDCQ